MRRPTSSSWTSATGSRSNSTSWLVDDQLGLAAVRLWSGPVPAARATRAEAPCPSIGGRQDHPAQGPVDRRCERTAARTLQPSGKHPGITRREDPSTPPPPPPPTAPRPA